MNTLTLDERRGIQNAHERASQLPTRTPVGERFLREKYEREESKVNLERERVEQETLLDQNRLESAQAEATYTKYVQTQQARRLVQENANRLLQKKLLSRINPASKNILRTGISLMVFAYMWQFIFALGTLVGFAMHGHVLYLRHETIGGKILGFVVDFQNWLPFEALGYAFFALTLLIVIITFIPAYACLQLFGYKPIGSMVAFFVTATLLGLSIFPVTNLFPWLIIWFVFIGMFSKSRTS